jgi:hypothetical protein
MISLKPKPLVLESICRYSLKITNIIIIKVLLINLIELFIKKTLIDKMNVKKRWTNVSSPGILLGNVLLGNNITNK